ncbi:hypothetical protein [Ralstonia solanacearum]
MNLQHERIDGLCSQLKLDRIASDWERSRSTLRRPTRAWRTAWE